MSGRDWRDFDAELRARVPELAVELLGKPTFRAGQEWRWGRKGSLSVVIYGARAGMWFDHEEGRGGWFSDLVGRDLGMARDDANDWIADRIGMGARHRPVRQRPAPQAMPANDPAEPPSAPETTPPDGDADAAPSRADEAVERATRIWDSARPAPKDHPYLVAKQAAPLALRMDARHRLVVPLQDIGGGIRSLEFIAPDGAKRFLAGGAKKGHFVVVGAVPAPLEEPSGPVLICEGWATGASLHIATGHTVIAAMDASNLMPVAEALENGHDAAGAELVHEMTEAGSVRALRLRWRSTIRKGWAAQAPILHLDATLRPELVQTYLPRIDIGTPVAARQPHVRVRQVTGSPTSARALTPAANAPERDRKSAATRLRDLRAWIDLRARQCHRPGQAIDLLVVGQKAAIDALRSAGLPPRVEAVHFNALSGLDRWGGIGGMVVLGRTLPAPRTVELIATALTGRVPVPNPEDAGWWYPMVERRVRLAGDRTAPLAMEEHADPIAEAVRWSICEGELIQAMGRRRGVNRTATTPLEIDLLTDVVLPVTVDALVPWSDLRPARRDLMALTGIVLENAADMAVCFPELWPTREAAKKDGQRKGTNDYYRDLHNSRMSPSSAEVTYRPQGPGHRTRTARVDLSRIPDPEAWLTNRLGPLASFMLTGCSSDASESNSPSDAAHLDTLASRLTASMQAVLAARRAALDARSARLEAAKPAALLHPHHPQPEEETEA